MNNFQVQVADLGEHVVEDVHQSIERGERVTMTVRRRRCRVDAEGHEPTECMWEVRADAPQKEHEIQLRDRIGDCVCAMLWRIYGGFPA